ncbi:hypothetical protein IHV25_10250, partial [Phaeovibrio sulfidiphilus]
ASGETVNLDILSFKNVVGTEYWLLDAGVDLTGKITLKYRGEDFADTRLADVLEGRLSDDKKVQHLKVVRALENRKLTWVGASGDTWNLREKNKWKLPDSSLTQFAPGDAVVFTRDNVGDVNVNKGGVVVAGMEITGGTFVFKGGEIVSAADKETNYTPATRKMELSGNADATFEESVKL